MKRNLLSLLLLFSLSIGAAWAQSFVNLTPKPKTLTTTGATFTLTSDMAVNCNNLDSAMTAEVERFVADVNTATGYHLTVTTGNSEAAFQVHVSTSSTIGASGYMLNVTDSRVILRGKDVLGIFYGLQSIKKMLPPNVMAVKADESVTSYTLPGVSITDEPRFDYRGFMLDVSRHFFTVEEVKRMIDVMAYYKMNRFHWHLTDDQGWRVEIKKYPKLTTVGATAPNCRFTDMYECKQYWINKEYGPYFYTQDEIRDVVAYAKTRHIEIIPEIDMPGHFCAAMTAYPEFSCNPSGSHEVWSDGGISYDVLNVGNPKAVQFVKDVLTELMDLFPYEYIHIGGDECPTDYWKSNADCQALYAKLGLTNYRQLQSHFIKEMNDHVKARGRQLAVWNEGITAEGADTTIMKETGALVYCWTGADAAVKKATSLGMPSVYTTWGPYYINRKQGTSANEPPGAADGSDNVMKTYNTNPTAGTSLGVQGTFWTEHVSDREYMEWLALPRLIAIAEHGWSPESQMNWSDFQQRITADTLLLRYNDYKYCNYRMVGCPDDAGGSSSTDKVLPKANTETAKYYYRIISGGTDETRVGRCIELLSSTSALVTTYSAKGASANRLWTNAQAAEGDANYDYQWWSIEADPAGSGKYALVCKAAPNGSVNPTPTAESTAGRWTYDTNTKNYNFTLGANGYGTIDNDYYYTISSDKVSGKYFNSSMSGQGLAVNVYNDPASGRGGYWQFTPFEDYGDGSSVEPITFPYLEVGKSYTFSNAVEGFDGTYIIDKGTSTKLACATDGEDEVAWTVTKSTVNEDGSQTLRLKNAQTGRYISSVGSYETRLGYGVSVGTSATDLTLSYVPAYEDYRLQISEKSLFPLPSGSIYAGATVSGASYDASRGQGAEWLPQEVNVIAFTCVDTDNVSIKDVKKAIPASITEITLENAPAIKNHEAVSITKLDSASYSVTYKRSAYAVTYKATDSKGVLVATEETTVPVGESYTVALPDVPYYTLSSADVTDGTALTLTADTTFNAVYTTDAITGVKAVGEAVTARKDLKSGNQYLLYDATTASGRSGYRLIRESDNQVNRATSVSALGPNAVWTLEQSGAGFKVKNEYRSLYVPALVRSTATTASTTGAVFAFTLNSDGETWNVKGSNGQYWDGLESGALVGWDGGTGHPIAIYTFYAQPLFEVSLTCEDEEGTTLSSSSELVKAGEAYTLSFPTIEGYTFKSVTGAEEFTGTVEKHLTLTAVYAASTEGINTVTADSPAKTGIYDLQGRRLQRVPQKGIYIINGQKALVK